MKQEVSFLLVLCASVVVMSFDPSGRDYYRQVPDIEEKGKYDIRFTEYKETAKKYNIKSKRATPSNVSNITTIQDHHLYYTSEYIPPGNRADGLWFELTDLIGSGDSSNPNVSETILQSLHLSYQVWDLKFEFPFYGHKINRVGVATGGFLYTGTFFHSRIHLTQFIAPLQANFNPSLNDTAKLLVYSTDTRFTVQWDQVHNHDHVGEGPFSFQVSLFLNGTIHFAYREIPLSINEISTDNHPVEVGLADAFYIDINVGFLIFRYVYEYSRIQLNSTQRLENSAYIITPVKNCVVGTSCETCAAITDESLFSCEWCPNISRCSDGIDRHRQEWFVSGCNNDAVESCGSKCVSSYCPFSCSYLPSLKDSPSHSSSPLSSTFLSPSSSPLSSTFLSPSSPLSSTFLSPSSPLSSTFLSPSSSPTPSLATSPTSLFSSQFFSPMSLAPISSSPSSSVHSVIPTPTYSVTPIPTIIVSPGISSPNTLSTTVVAGIIIVIAVIIILIVAVIVMIAIFLYGYRKPQSRLGLYMIEHRLKARSLNRTVKYEVQGEKAILY